MAFFYKYVDPSTLLVDTHSKDDSNDLTAENTPLANGDKQPSDSYTGRMNHRNGPSSPDPDDDPNASGYESQL